MNQLIPSECITLIFVGRSLTSTNIEIFIKIITFELLASFLCLRHNQRHQNDLDNFNHNQQKCRLANFLLNLGQITTISTFIITKNFGIPNEAAIHIFEFLSMSVISCFNQNSYLGH